MTIHKLEKFKNILGKYRKVELMNATLSDLKNYLDSQRSKFEEFKNNITGENEVIMEEFQGKKGEKEGQSAPSLLNTE